MKQPALRPSDIVTALQLAIKPGAKLADLAISTDKSLGETHNAVSRLARSALLLPDSRLVAREALAEFIRWGVPIAFPAVTGGPAVGVPTARTGADAVLSPDPTVVGRATAEFVWPWASGPAAGTALVPLYPAAPRMATNNPALAGLLALVDLVRIGGARERDAAMAELVRQLSGGGTG